jgi:multicomponent Na+:H+ antiporter subunit C
LFFVLLGMVHTGTIPVHGAPVTRPMHNPLPHALMLTAIVVGVATFGVAAAILLRIQREARSIDDDAPTNEDDA